MLLKDMKVLILSPEEALLLKPPFLRSGLRENVQRADMVLVVREDGCIEQILKSRHFKVPAAAQELPQDWCAPVLRLVPDEEKQK